MRALTGGTGETGTLQGSDVGSNEEREEGGRGEPLDDEHGGGVGVPPPGVPLYEDCGGGVGAPRRIRWYLHRLRHSCPSVVISLFQYFDT